jgi:hypothetical protein
MINRVMIGPDQWANVKECPLGGKLGEAHLGTGEIRIERDQPEAGKHVILLHEMLHIAEERLCQCGILGKPSPEAYIEHMAFTLFAMLAGSGLWNGMNLDDVERFLEGMAE